MCTETAVALHNQLTGFLEEVVKKVPRLDSQVQTVALSPNYGETPDLAESGELAKELRALIIDEAAKAPTPLPSSKQGYVVRISENHSRLVRRYIRTVVLYPEPPQVGHCWIQVRPPCYDGEGKIINR